MVFLRGAFLSVVLGACLVSCGGEGEVSEKKDPVIAVIPKSTGGEYWETVEGGARRAAAELGVAMKWEGTVSETEIAEQNKIIENMVNLGVDGIALAPLNRTAMSKQVASAVDAGIPVVIFDSAVDGDAQSCFIATDNQRGGELAAEEMARVLGTGAKRVLVMRFVQGAASTEARADGFIASATAAGHEVVADPYPDTGTIEGCKTTAANTLETFVSGGKLEIDGIFAANLYATAGVASALDDLRKGGVETDVCFVGFDTSKRLVAGVQEGKIHALVAQDPDKMGELAVKTIVDVVEGKPGVPEFIDTGTVLVTAEALEGDAAVRKLVGLE